MTLKDLIAEYIKENNLSYRSFASACGISSAYLSMIKTGNNPSTGEPPVVSLQMLSKIASGMGKSVHQLIQIVDDMPVDISENPQDSDIPFSIRAQEVARAYDTMSDYGKAIIDLVVAQEEKQRKESFGKPKLLCSGGYKVVPSILGKDDSDLFIEYNARQESKELAEEESHVRQDNI